MEEPNSKLWFSRRLFLVILIFLGYVNLGVLQKTWNAVDILPEYRKIASTSAQQYTWLKYTIAPSSFGKLFSVVGGYFAIKYGGASVCGISLLAISLMTILTPVLSHFCVYSVFLWSSLNGLFQGFFHSSVPEIIIRWAPIKEKATMMSYSLSGMLVGLMIANFKSKQLNELWENPIAFYVTGSISLFWSILWFTFATNEPSIDERISSQELLYIEQMSNDTSRKQITIPWKHILTSKPVWALCVSRLTLSYVLSFVIWQAPVWMKLSKTNEKHSHEILSSVSYILCGISFILMCYIIDTIAKKNKTSMTSAYKLTINTTYSFGISLVLFLIPINDHPIPHLVFHVIIQTSLLCTYLVLQLVPLYISPQQSSIVAGIAFASDSLGNVFAPSYVSYILNNLSYRDECITHSIVLVVGLFATILFGSFDVQSWSRPTPHDHHLNELRVTNQNSRH